MKIIVTAGGQGTKLWPYSRLDKPKQFQPIIGDRTSYQETIDTLLKAYTPEDIFISTKRKFIKYVSEQTPNIPLKNYIIEPDMALDRGPAEGLAFLRLSMKHPDEPFVIVQADCVRDPDEKFLEMLYNLEGVVKKTKKFVTGGIKATEPNLGVDYLQLGKQIDANGGHNTFTVEHFAGRRGTFQETKRLIEDFHVVAHCYHSCWYPDMMLEAYKQYRPDWHKSLMDIREVIDKPGEDGEIERLYVTMQKGPTEDVIRKVMEAGDALAMLLPYKWTDVGTWNSVYEFFSDGVANYEDGEVVAVDASGSLVKTNRKDKLIAIAGVKNLVIVDTDDALLVVPKDKIEKVKDIQGLLAELGHDQYL